MGEPLEPNHQLRWALQQLPTPTDAATQVRVLAPALEEGAPDIEIVLARAELTHAGQRVAGWLYEGEVRVPEGDQRAEAGSPGLAAWLCAELGPYCLELDILDQRPG